MKTTFGMVTSCMNDDVKIGKSYLRLVRRRSWDIWLFPKSRQITADVCPAQWRHRAVKPKFVQNTPPGVSFHFLHFRFLLTSSPFLPSSFPLSPLTALSPIPFLPPIFVSFFYPRLFFPIPPSFFPLLFTPSPLLSLPSPFALWIRYRIVVLSKYIYGGPQVPTSRKPTTQQF